ncbi:MAG: glutamate dehydrogenase, partial [Idiomarinaceae bacterium]|nr:glutamate dehydrogenase [Idiomarinaceae bacterium]
DSNGTIYHEQGIDLDLVKEIKEVRHARLSEYCDTHEDAEFTAREDYPEDGEQIWRYKADVAFPCATQNELNEHDAQCLLENGVKAVVEGANMPCTQKAIDLFVEQRTLFGPGKAANAGGVATSQLEMAQNASMTRWTQDEVDEQLQCIMRRIYNDAKQTAEEFDQPNNLVLGANIAGFRRVADAMIEQGVV